MTTDVLRPETRRCMNGRPNTKKRTPSDVDGAGKRVKGVEPSTFTLAIRFRRSPKSAKTSGFPAILRASKSFASLRIHSRFFARNRGMCGTRTVEYRAACGPFHCWARLGAVDLVFAARSRV